MLFTAEEADPEAGGRWGGVDGVVAAGPVVDQAAVSAVEVVSGGGAAVRGW